MPRIDRNALAGNRTRRDWQRLSVSTATGFISVSEGQGNLLTYSTGSGGGYEVIIPATHNLYVDVDGNDATGTPNYFGRPYQNISTALAVASTMAPATVWLGTGTWNIGSTQLLGPNGVNIIGSGNCRGDSTRGGTIITGTRPYLSGRMLVPGSDVIYAGFYVDGSQGVNTVCIGFYATPDPSTATNVLMSDIGAYGNRAGFALANVNAGATYTSTLQYLLINCWFQGHLDGLNTHFTTTTSTCIAISTVDCEIIGWDDGTAGFPQLAAVNFTQYGTWFDSDSIVAAYYTSTSGSQPVDAAQAQASSQFVLHGTYLTAMNSSGGSTYQVDSKNGASITLDLACGYNPLSTSDGTGIIIAPYLNIGDIATVASTGVITNFPVGTAGQVLTADPATSTGLVWSTGSGGSGSLPIISTGDLVTVSTNGSTVRLPKGNPYYILTTVPSTSSGTDLEWLGQLYASANDPTLDWFDQQLLDPFGFGGTSIDWMNRWLYDASGVVGINYAASLLNYDGGNTSVDYGDGYLVANNGSTVLQWPVTTLFSSTGSTIWNWGSSYSSSLFLASPSTTTGLFSTRGIVGYDIGMKSTGDIVFMYSTGAIQRLAIGSANQVLSVNPVPAFGSTILQWTNVTLSAQILVASDNSSTIISTNNNTIAGNWTGTIDFLSQPSTYILAGPSSGAKAVPTFIPFSTLANNISTAVLPVVATNPAAATAGQAWYNSTNAQAEYQASTLGALPFGATIIASAQLVAITANTTPQIFSNCSTTFPSSYCNLANRMFNITGAFEFVTPIGLGDTFSIGMVFGSTSTIVYTTPALTGAIGGATVLIQGVLGVRATGTSGTAYFAFSINGAENTGPSLITFAATQIGPINLTSTVPFAFYTSATSTTTAYSTIVESFFMQQVF